MFDHSGNFTSEDTAAILRKKISPVGWLLLSFLFDEHGTYGEPFSKYNPLRVVTPGYYEHVTRVREFVSLEEIRDYVSESWAYSSQDSFDVLVPHAISECSYGDDIDHVVISEYFERWHSDIISSHGRDYSQVTIPLTDLAYSDFAEQDTDQETISALAVDILSAVPGYMESEDSERSELVSTWFDEQFESWIKGDIERDIYRFVGDRYAEYWNELDDSQAKEYLTRAMNDCDIYPDVNGGSDSVHFESSTGMIDYDGMIHHMIMLFAADMPVPTLEKA